LTFRFPRRPILSSTAVLLLATTPSRAHDLAFTDSRLVVRADGTFQAVLTCDLDALALGIDAKTDARAVVAAILAKSPREREALAEDLRGLLAKRVRVRFDGVPAPFEVGFPGRAKDSAAVAGLPNATVFGLTAELAGPVPPGARAVTFWASRAFPPVNLEVVAEGSSRHVREVLESGEESPPFPLGGRVTDAGRLPTFFRYLRLGFWHIVPEGIDHVLFVLGLFLLSPRLRPLLVQVSAFTVAHTATLALSTLGVVRLPPSVVEPLIALSIAYVAVENTLFTTLRPWRVALVLGFGLLHGLGFAGALGKLGLPRGDFLAGLLAFNAGVELGQLAVLAVAFLTIGAFRARPWYRRRIVVPLSLGIAVVGFYWTVARSLHSL
jgi:HupE/UreJ protein